MRAFVLGLGVNADVYRYLGPLLTTGSKAGMREAD